MNCLTTSSSDSEFTGRYLVLFAQNKIEEGITLVKDLCSLSNVATTAEIGREPERAIETDIIVAETLGIAVVN